MPLTTVLDTIFYVLCNFNLYSDPTNQEKFRICTKNLDAIMRLDLSAINALSIFPRLGTFKNQASDNETLIGVMDFCKTYIGSRLLRNWLQQPLQDIPTIENRLDVVQMLIEERDLRNYCQNDFLKKVPDLQKLFGKFYKVENGKKHNCKLMDCYKVYQLIGFIRQTLGWLSNFDSLYPECLAKNFTEPLSVILEEFGKYEEFIENSLDMSRVRFGEFIINSKFSSRLGEIERDLKKAVAKIDDVKDSVTIDLDN